jgi:type I pantothenate kinase
MGADGSYLDLDRDAWRRLRGGAAPPQPVGPIGRSEVEDIYLPLSRLVQLYYEEGARRREAVAAFLGEQARAVPFIVAVAGSVAVGKSVTARVLRTLIEHWPQRPRAAL